LVDVLASETKLAAMGLASKARIDRWSFAEDIAGLRAALAHVLPGRIAP
jgi:hypothetical protein